MSRLSPGPVAPPGRVLARHPSCWDDEITCSARVGRWLRANFQDTKEVPGDLAFRSFLSPSTGGGGSTAGLLLVSAPLNWQIDYVVVRPDPAPGRGSRWLFVNETVNQALARPGAYVMLQQSGTAAALV